MLHRLLERYLLSALEYFVLPSPHQFQLLLLIFVQFWILHRGCSIVNTRPQSYLVHVREAFPAITPTSPHHAHLRFQFQHPYHRRISHSSSTSHHNHSNNGSQTPPNRHHPIRHRTPSPSSLPTPSTNRYHQYLGILTIIAAYASHSSSTYHLPIPNSLTALTLALPPVAGLTIETSNALATALSTSPKHRQAAKSTIPPVLLPGTLTLAALLIYETVIATLAGTKIGPVAALDGALRERWRALYEGGEERALMRLQERFRCCGLEGRGDMSVPNRNGEVWERGCLGPWRGEQRLVGGLMLGVAIGVFLWMVSLLDVRRGMVLT